MYASLPGKVLRSRYQVLQPLGRGGFGQTYIAEDLDLPGHPRCVVKHLKPASSDSFFLDNARRLFQTEAQTLLRLGTHDQIPRLLAYFEEDAEFYLVQELIEGHPLTEDLLPGQHWSELAVVQMLEDVLGILQFIHTQGVIHRDLKPDNLIRRRSDRKLVLVDFGTVKEIRTPGFSRRSRGSSVATIAVGTPGYMPTEQGRGKPRPNSDIYALGVIAIQAVTGLNPEQLQEDAETGEIIWRPWAQVSDRFAEILTQMVRYYFRDRYQSAQQVLADLAPLLGKVPSVDVDQPPEPAATLVLPPIAVPQPSAIKTFVSPPPPEVAPAPAAEAPMEMVASEPQSIPSSPAPLEEKAQSLSESGINLLPTVDADRETPSTAYETLVSPEPQPETSSSPVPARELDAEIDPLPRVDIASSAPSGNAIPAHTESIAQPSRSIAIPQLSRTTIATIGLGAAGAVMLGSALMMIQPRSQSPTSLLPTPESSPKINIADQHQEILDTAIDLAKDGKDNDLEQAIKKTKEIPSNSPIYIKAKSQLFTWQAKLLQNYLQIEAVKKYPKIADILQQTKPEIKRLNNDEIVLAYDASSNAKYSDSEVVKNFLVVFVELLRGNKKDVFRIYADFNQITVYPLQGKQKATLVSSDWDAYVEAGAEGDQILDKIKLTEK